MSDEITKNELYNQIQKDNYKNLFQSMFPNHSLM
jgi:hypothetical protein